jgi:replicative superfamily II helicase
MKGLLQSLRRRGFDRSEYDRSRGTHHVRCSQCEALVINGVACHEAGCPNEKRKRRG